MYFCVCNMYSTVRLSLFTCTVCNQFVILVGNRVLLGEKITHDKKTLQVNYPFPLTHLHQTQPVSYTHLDVYKRQIL